MPVSSILRGYIYEFLEPAEEIHYVFPAEVLGSVSPDVVFVVSGQAITVLSTNALGRNRIKSVLSRNPRNTRIGPVDTNTTSWFTWKGVQYEVDDEYVSVVNAADAEIDPSGGRLSDPLPDL